MAKKYEKLENANSLDPVVLSPKHQIYASACAEALVSKDKQNFAINFYWLGQPDPQVPDASDPYATPLMYVSLVVLDQLDAQLEESWLEKSVQDSLVSFLYQEYGKGFVDVNMEVLQQLFNALAGKPAFLQDIPFSVQLSHMLVVYAHLCVVMEVDFYEYFDNFMQQIQELA